MDRLEDSFDSIADEYRVSERWREHFYELFSETRLSLTAKDARIRELEEALEKLDRVLHDWIVTYAAEFAGEDQVRSALKRIGNSGGTLGYISDARDGIKRAINKKEQS